MATKAELQAALLLAQEEVAILRLQAEKLLEENSRLSSSEDRCLNQINDLIDQLAANAAPATAPTASSRKAAMAAAKQQAMATGRAVRV